MKRRAGRLRKKKSQNYLRWVIFGVFFLFTLVTVLLLRTKYWNLGGKFAVVKSSGQDVIISLYDSKAGSQTDIVIPGNTQVLAAYNLGTWKLGSLWKLGVDEKIGGSLVTRTISVNFGFPVFVWTDTLSVGDKLRIKLFSLFSQKNKDTILLKETGYLKKTVFMDGENGYLITKDTPEEISSLFSDQEEFGNSLKAKIIDSSGSYGVANKVGRIIETMGIKVASISKEFGTDDVCEIAGNNKKLVKKVALMLGCKESKTKDLNNFDLEVFLGKKFIQEF